MPQQERITNAVPTVFERMASLSAWVLAAGVFLTVGWTALAPGDPLGPVSVFTGRGGVWMLVQAAALTAVVAGLATLLTGRQLPDAGVFAAGFGLAVMSIRGGTAAYFFLPPAEETTSIGRSLLARFAIESIGWFGVICVAIATSTVVMKYCVSTARSTGDDDSTRKSHSVGPMAGGDLPFLGNRSDDDQRTLVADGWRHMLVAAGVAFVVFAILSEGLSDRTVRHGQACFVVAAAVYIGVYVGYRMIPVRSALWSVLAVLLFVLLGDLWAFVRPATGIRPPAIPASPFVRILPIQFICVGTAAAVAAFWHLHMPFAEQEASSVVRHPSGEKKR